jgi:hypothetical protein
VRHDPPLPTNFSGGSRLRLHVYRCAELEALIAFVAFDIVECGLSVRHLDRLDVRFRRMTLTASGHEIRVEHHSSQVQYI